MKGLHKMPVEIGKIPGVLINKKEHEKFCCNHNVCTCGNSQFNNAITTQSTVQIGINREKLASCLYSFIGELAGKVDFKSCPIDVRKTYLKQADGIIAKEHELFEVKT